MKKQRESLPDLSPMLGVLGTYPSDDKNYAFELKWDGYRALAYWDGQRLRFESRNKIDFTKRYPPLALLADALGPRPMVLDGEIVALDSIGRSDFGLLQQWPQRFVENPRKSTNLRFEIFDVLYWNGRAVYRLPYRDRRAVLEKLKLRGPVWDTPASVLGSGKALLRTAKQRGFEGVMAKRLDSVYETGERSAAWIKIKIVDRQEFVIAGWIPGKESLKQGLGSAMLGYFGPGPGRKRVLHYAGNVGTGFDFSGRIALRQFLDGVAIDANPFAERVPFRDAHFARPILVAEIEFRGWTPDGHLRQASFKGLRTDKKSTDVVRERANAEVTS